MDRENIEARTDAAERLRQYAEVVLTVAAYQDAEMSASLTGSEPRATVSAGSEVESQTHLTTQYDQ